MLSGNINVIVYERIVIQDLTRWRIISLCPINIFPYESLLAEQPFLVMIHWHHIRYGPGGQIWHRPFVWQQAEMRCQIRWMSSNKAIAGYREPHEHADQLITMITFTAVNR